MKVLTAAYMAEVEYRGGIYAPTPDTLANIRALAVSLTKEKPMCGVMLCGTPGNGKTTLLLAFRSALNWLNDNNAFECDRSMRIVDAKDIQRCAKDFKSFDELRKRDMLAIEDMGREATEVLDYGNVMSPVIDLLEHRYNEQLYTFITTNLTATQVRKKYGNRIADRFNEMLDVIIFKGDSYRR